MIEKACKEMDRRNIKVLRTSSLYETEAMYVEDQQSFINGACEVSATIWNLADIQTHLNRHSRG